MADYLAFPDIEAVVCAALAAADVVSPGSVGSDIPPSPVFPLLVVQRLGGSPGEKRKLDCARIQVDAWADTKQEARDVAEGARVAVFSLEGRIDNEFSAMVSAVEPETGLIWMQDPETGRPRYHFTSLVYAFST